MRKLCFSLTAIFLLFFSCKKSTSEPQEQPPPENPFVRFSKVYGGSQHDVIVSALPALDGGYVLSGVSESNDGDITTGHGFSDLWLLKIDASGNVVWSQTYGGSGEEFFAMGIVPMTDGYIIAGATTSTDGNVTITKDDFRQHWLLKVDKQGNILWQKKFSQLEGAQVHAIIKAKNGDLVGCGYAFPAAGQSNAWMFRLTAAGELIWEETYDDLTDVFGSVGEAPNGDLVATGTTVEANNPDQMDALLLRTNNLGELKWSKSLGGSTFDMGNGVVATSDGGALMTSTTNSTDGLATGNHGNEDILVVKVDENGDVEWNKVIGGTSGETYTRCVIETSDHNYKFTAESYSQDGDFPGNVGYDAWIVTLNAAGSIVKKTKFGGNGSEGINGLLPIGDKKYLSAGYTTSNTGEFSGAHGAYEGWIFTYEE